MVSHKVSCLTPDSHHISCHNHQVSCLLDSSHHVSLLTQASGDDDDRVCHVDCHEECCDVVMTAMTIMIAMKTTIPL